MGALYYRYRVLWAHFRRWYGPRHTLLKTLYPPLPCGMQILIQHCQFHCYLILHCITTRETMVATMSALCISRDSWSMTSSGFGHDSIFDTMLYLGYLWTNCHGDRTKPSRTCTPRTLTPGHISSPPPPPPRHLQYSWTSHICCEEGFSPHNCSGSRWALGWGWVGGSCAHFRYQVW